MDFQVKIKLCLRGLQPTAMRLSTDRPWCQWGGVLSMRRSNDRPWCRWHAAEAQSNVDWHYRAEQPRTCPSSKRLWVMNSAHRCRRDGSQCSLTDSRRHHHHHHYYISLLSTPRNPTSNTSTRGGIGFLNHKPFTQIPISIPVFSYFESSFVTVKLPDSKLLVFDM